MSLGGTFSKQVKPVRLSTGSSLHCTSGMTQGFRVIRCVWMNLGKGRVIFCSRVRLR